MPNSRSIRVAKRVAMLLLFSAAFSNSPLFGQNERPAAAPPAAQKPDWLEGSGKELRIRLAGTVHDETGVPVNDCRIRITQRTQHSRNKILPRVVQNGFRASVPVGDVGWFFLHVVATSKDGRRVARADIAAFELRQLAIDGLNLTLRPPERSLEVTVVDNERPVAGAHVTADIGGATFDAETNDMGIARIPLMNRDRLSQLTAWSDDFRLGGFSFHRDPPRAPTGSRFTIELERCRPQIIWVINVEDQKPVPNLEFKLTVGTGPPDFQFPGRTPDSELRTNEKGEAIYRWFPDWKQHGSYLESLDPRWIKAEREETVGGVLVVTAKSSRFDERKRVTGQVVSPGRSVAGLFVEMWSFQGEEEHRSDVVYGFTDENGLFAANYLPGATYCINVNDARFVSDIIDLIPFDPAEDETNSPSLTLREGQLVEVHATFGPKKTPIPYQWIQLETPHRYSWLENGKEQSGQGGRRWSVTTDAEGRAHSYALPGHELRASIYAFELRKEATVKVGEEGVTRLEIDGDRAEEADKDLKAD